MRIEELNVSESAEAEAPIVAGKRHSKSGIVEATSTGMVESEEMELNIAAGKKGREQASPSS